MPATFACREDPAASGRPRPTMPTVALALTAVLILTVSTLVAVPFRAGAPRGLDSGVSIASTIGGCHQTTTWSNSTRAYHGPDGFLLHYDEVRPAGFSNSTTYPLAV